jgi:cytochrome c oxidase cbb3-type subunit I/II
LVEYNDRIAGRFLQATVGWGLLALFIGFYGALELQFWPVQGPLPFLTFGRLRPLHSNLMVFAFAANALFAGMYHAVQRLCQSRIWSDRLTLVHFWGWQLMLLLGLISLAFGYTQARPLAEMEWPLDILLALIWSLFSLNIFMTLRRRQTPFLYVSLWFFCAGLLIFGLVHLVNAVVMPASLTKSYPFLVGVGDAVVQVWYAQNLKSFLLTLPFLGLMYYFVPKTVKRPLHSYRLAILQFWALVFFSVWTGPAKLAYTSLPEWMQSIGLIFSLMLVAPGWAAVINGVSTIGLDDPRFRRHPAVLFFFLALLSYGASVGLEALTAFKSINLVLQYSDWVSAESHLLMMGWIGSFIFGMAYVLVPKLWQHQLHSRTLGRLHFWITLSSLILMLLALAAGGLVQGQRWFAVQEDGLLVYPEFLATIEALKPFYMMRLISHGLFLLGTGLALYNFYQTARQGKLQDTSRPLETLILPEALNRWEQWSRRVWPLTAGVLILVIGSSLIQLLPLPDQTTELKPYTPLAQHGRDIYMREGCQSCHTQMVRVALKEELRYGSSSQIWEYQQDRPALWGQRRHGPDLHRVGGRYPHLWHYQHLVVPQTIAPGSVMPSYQRLVQNKVNRQEIMRRHTALKKLGVGYGPEDPLILYDAEARKIQESLAQAQIVVDPEAEIIALIAYLQVLGIEPKQ